MTVNLVISVGSARGKPLCPAPYHLSANLNRTCGESANETANPAVHPGKTVVVLRGNVRLNERFYCLCGTQSSRFQDVNVTDSDENKEKPTDSDAESGSETPENSDQSQAESSDEAVASEDAANDLPAESSVASGTTPETVADDDELPEEVELTPELVEDEAIRGDFMLRCATVCLAVLFGFSQMADTRTLVHIRSGEDLRANGFMPSGQDHLSYAAEIAGKPFVNLSWLFDHVVSAVYSAGGPTGLTLFKALIAGIIGYLLSRISTRGMPTWWNSICCAFAISACSVDFVPITDLATLVGLTLTLLLLHRYDDRVETGLIWKLPLVIAVWANLDSRAYLGVFAAGLFALGASIRQGRSLNAGDAPGPETSTLWKAATFSVIALLVNPAPLASLFSVISTYSVEYPAMLALKPMAAAGVLDGRTENAPLWSPELSAGFEFAYLAGLVILLIAFVVIAIARHRVDLPWAVTLTGFALLAVAALHELPAAALVAAATAGVAAQRWYGRMFRQEYTIDPGEVLFSRAGRAVTVLAMAGLAFLVVADRLPTRTPIGLGFEKNLQSTVTSLGQQLEEIAEDANVLNTRLSQGDLMIWHGRKSFMDSRVKSFGRPDDVNSLTYRFTELRNGLLPQPEEEEDNSGVAGSPAIPEGLQPGEAEAKAAEEAARRTAWEEEYKTFEISEVMIRLAPPGRPPYAMIASLVQMPEWRLVSRGASAAFFRRVPEGVPEDDVFSIRDIAFREEVPEDRDVLRVEVAREQNFYEKYVYASRKAESIPNRLAKHYFSIDSQVPAQLVQQIVASAMNTDDPERMTQIIGAILAGPTMTIRSAQEAVKEDPQDADAYRLMGLAYRQLGMCESTIAQISGGTDAQLLRSCQAIMALRQAATIEPDVPDTWSGLALVYQENRRMDLALECIEKFGDLQGYDQKKMRTQEEEESFRQMDQLRQSLQQAKQEVEARVQQVLDSSDVSSDPKENARQKFALAQQLYADGHVRVALDLLNDNQEVLRAMPHADALRGQMLLEAGELEDAALLLDRLPELIRANADQPGIASVPWHMAVALSRLSRGDYEGAKDVWKTKSEAVQEAAEQAVQDDVSLQFMPLMAIEQPGGKLPHWPVRSAQIAEIPLTAFPRSRAEPMLLSALLDIEAGRLDAAEKSLRTLLTESGGTSMTPLATVYIRQLNDDVGELLEETLVNVWDQFSFPELESGDGAKPADEGEEQTSEDAPAENEAASDETPEDDKTTPNKPNDPSAEDSDTPKSESVTEEAAPTTETEAGGDSEPAAE